MNSKLIKLAERRATLVAKAESQRRELAQAFEPWRGPLAIADSGAVALRFVVQHKALLVGALAFTVALGPRLAFGVLRKGWLVWRTVLAVKRRLGG
jgi:hypothetical protein